MGMSIEELNSIADAVVNKLKPILNSTNHCSISMPENKTLRVKGKVNYLSSDCLETSSEDTEDPNKVGRYFMKADSRPRGVINIDVTNRLPTLGQVLFVIPEKNELTIYKGNNKLKITDWHPYDDYKVIKIELNCDAFEITIEDKDFF